MMPLDVTDALSVENQQLFYARISSPARTTLCSCGGMNILLAHTVGMASSVNQDGRLTVSAPGSRISNLALPVSALVSLLLSVTLAVGLHHCVPPCCMMPFSAGRSQFVGGHNLLVLLHIILPQMHQQAALLHIISP